ncbi:hypothetical protein GCM10027053_42330 [Intrasporangium mesophilum]
MTSFDDLTDSSPEGPVGVPEGLTEDESTTRERDPREDAERGNLDGSTAHDDTRADTLDASRQAVRDPSGAGSHQRDLGSDPAYDPQSADAGESGQDNGRNE